MSGDVVDGQSILEFTDGEGFPLLFPRFGSGMGQDSCWLKEIGTSIAVLCMAVGMYVKTTFTNIFSSVTALAIVAQTTVFDSLFEKEDEEKQARSEESEKKREGSAKWKTVFFVGMGLTSCFLLHQVLTSEGNLDVRETLFESGLLFATLILSFVDVPVIPLRAAFSP